MPIKNKDYLQALSQGVSSPLMQRLQQPSRGDTPLLPYTRDTEYDNLSRQIGNYQNRLSSVGIDPPEPKNKTNIFIKALQWLDKPRNALWNATQDLVTGENGFFQGLKEGWTGEERYEGKDLMEDLFGTPETGLGKFGHGLGGFVAEAVLDPLNLVTTGAGSLAKGFLTGSGKTLTREGAEKLATSMLKQATKEGGEALIKQGGRNLTGEALEQALKNISYNKADDVLKKLGLQLDNARGLYKSADNIYTEAFQKSVDKLLGIDKTLNAGGKGLSFAGKTIDGLTNARMQDIGAEASKWVRDNTGVVGKGFGAVQDSMSKMFSSKYVLGLDKAEQSILKYLKGDSLGTRNLMDDKLAKEAMDWDKALSDIGAVYGSDKRNLITQYLEGKVNADQLDKVSLDVADKMKSKYARWEYLEDINSSVKNYFPHMQNWDNLEGMRQMRLGGVTEKMKLDNPSSLSRRMGDDIVEANQRMLFRTANEQARVDFLTRAGLPVNKTMLSADDISKIKALPDAGDLWGMLKDGGGVDNFFESDPVRAVISRGLRHNKLMTEKGFLDDVISAFGTRVTMQNVDDYIREGFDIVIPRSYLTAYGVNVKQLNELGANVANFTGDIAKTLAGNGVDPADAQRLAGLIQPIIEKQAGTAESVLKDILDVSRGASFAKVHKNELALLVNKYNMQAYALPAGVTKQINDASAKQIEAGIQTLGGLIDTFNRAWKPSVTGLRPSYHTRNAVGSTFQNVMDIGMRTFDPRINTIAEKVVRGTDDVVELAGKNIPLKDIKEAMIKTHASSTFMRADAKTIKQALSDQYGIGTSGIIGKINKAGKSVGNAIEDRVRAVNFVANLESALEQGIPLSKAFEFAGEKVKQFHFDYTDLAKAEKDVIRRLVPFYTWARKNMPLQLENFFNTPSFYHKVESFGRNMEGASGVDSSNMPEWFREAMPVALPFIDAGQGKTAYANMSLPVADLGTLTDPKQLMSMLTPLLKVPFEFTSNRQMLTGAPISQYEGQTRDLLGVNMNNYLAHALEQFGVARDLNRLATPQTTSGRAVAPLEGYEAIQTLRAYDPYEAEKDALYSYNRQLGNEVQKARDEGRYVPDVNELNRIARDYPEYLPMIQEFGIIPPILLKPRQRR